MAIRSRHDAPFWSVHFKYPNSYAALGVEFQGSIAMGWDVVHYSTVVNFGDCTDPSGDWGGNVVTAQRPSSVVPEPGTLALLGVALGRFLGIPSECSCSRCGQRRSSRAKETAAVEVAKGRGESDS